MQSLPLGFLEAAAVLPMAFESLGGREEVAMATVQKAATRSQRVSRHPGAPSAAHAGLTSPRYDVGNEPNADILLTSLRSAGYSLESVVGDLIDNSIDATASLVVVNVQLADDSDEWIVEVADDGDGMDIETLDQMMRLGSRSEHDLTSDLGAFGLGSDTSALAIGRNKHVVTTYEAGAWASSMWDLDVVVRERKFVKHLGDAEPEEMEMFGAAFRSAHADVPETGTLVRISKCDRVGRKSVGPAQKSILRYVGQTYRRFLVPTGGLSVYVNGQQAEPIDPMMRSHPESMVLLDEQIDVEFKDRQGKTTSEKVGVFVVHLPDFGGQEANNENGIRIETSGFYVLRNGREITAATSLGLYARHNALSRFRSELNFPAALDSELGVTFLKSSHELRLTQALRDKIDAVVAPYRRQSRNLYYGSRPTAPESVPHDEAAKFIKSRSPFLRKPQAEIEKRGARVTDPTKSDGRTRGEPERDRSPRDRSQKSLADVAEFRAQAMGTTAPFYEGMLIGRKVIVTYNSDHPAYQRLILENRDNRGQITAIDFLVWSLVASELRNVDDDNARFMQAMREDASFNLRQLLTL
jgi:hypothetical protein